LYVLFFQKFSIQSEVKIEKPDPLNSQKDKNLGGEIIRI